MRLLPRESAAPPRELGSAPHTLAATRFVLDPHRAVGGRASGGSPDIAFRPLDVCHGATHPLAAPIHWHGRIVTRCSGLACRE